MLRIYKQATQAGSRFPASPSDSEVKRLKPFTVVGLTGGPLSRDRTKNRPKTSAESNVLSPDNTTIDITKMAGQAPKSTIPQNGPSLDGLYKAEVTNGFTVLLIKKLIM
jgi:hypothetical protein